MYVLLILITCLKLIFNVWKYCKKIINNSYYDIFEKTDCMLILILFIYKSYLEWKKIQLFQNTRKSRKVFKHIYFKSIFNKFKKYFR